MLVNCTRSSAVGRGCHGSKAARSTLSYFYYDDIELSVLFETMFLRNPEDAETKEILIISRHFFDMHDRVETELQRPENSIDDEPLRDWKPGGVETKTSTLIPRILVRQATFLYRGRTG